MWQENAWRPLSTDDIAHIPELKNKYILIYINKTMKCNCLRGDNKANAGAEYNCLINWYVNVTITLLINNIGTNIKTVE